VLLCCDATLGDAPADGSLAGEATSEATSRLRLEVAHPQLAATVPSRIRKNIQRKSVRSGISLIIRDGFKASEPFPTKWPLQGSGHPISVTGARFA
jgi:hypothetical protein